MTSSRSDPPAPERAAQDSSPTPAEPTAPREPDTTLDVQRAQVADDGSSWHGSWQRLSNRVQTFLRSNCGGLGLPPDVEFDDLLSAVLVRMLRDLPQLRLDGRTKFWAWVRRLAKNQAADEWRRHKSQRRGGARVHQQCDSGGIDLVGRAVDEGAEGASGALRRREIEEFETDCVERLPNERARRVYLMRRRLEMSFADITREVGDPHPEMTFSRARARVLECLRVKLDAYQPIIDRI